MFGKVLRGTFEKSDNFVMGVFSLRCRIIEIVLKDTKNSKYVCETG